MNNSGRKSKLVARDISDSLGKLPPQALQMEEAVLGAVMLESKAYKDVAEILCEDDFYREAHKAVWKAIQQLDAASDSIDMRTVVSQLKKIGQLELVGGMVFIVGLTNGVNSSANVRSHAKVVKEMALRRNIIEIASEMHNNAYDDTIDVFESINDLQRKAINLSLTSIKKRAVTQKELYTQTLMNLQAKAQFAGVTGVKTGFKLLDRMTSGWQETDLIIIAARPGMGKTAFMLATALGDSKPVAVFSLEMSAQQLEERMMSITYEINNERLKTGFMEDHQWTKLVNDPEKLSSRPVFIDDEAGLSIIDLKSRCRRLKAEHGIQLIIVDYLQLMRGERGKGDNREQEISSISRGLKGIAKELSVPVIALSQLSRGVETRGGDKRPQLSDLRESGSLEQDADMVVFLYRPEYYGITVDENGMPTKDMAEVIIEKHRSGATGTVGVKFIGPFTKFLDDEPRSKTLGRE